MSASRFLSASLRYNHMTCVLTADVHVNVGADITGECTVVLLTSVSSASAHCAVCCPHS